MARGAGGTGKINWLLILQGWAMLWVVTGHAPLTAPHSEATPVWCDFLYETAYSFHMPLFILISGFLFYLTRVSSCKWNYLPVMLDKLKRLGIPFVVFTILGIFLKYFFSSSVERPTELSPGEFFNAILYPSEGPVSGFWFLAAIMWHFALFPLWRKLFEHIETVAVFAVAAVLLHYFHPEVRMFEIGSACKYLIYFFMGLCGGYFYKKYDMKVENISLKVIFTTLSVSLLAYVLSRHFDSEFTMALAGIFFSTALALILDCYIPAVFSSFRNYTYQIYLMGIFAQIVIKILYARFGLPYLPMFFIAVAAGLYVPVIVSIVISRLPVKFFKLCIGLK